MKLVVEAKGVIVFDVFTISGKTSSFLALEPGVTPPKLLLLLSDVGLENVLNYFMLPLA